MQCRFLSFILFHIDSLIKKKDHPRVDPISFLIRDHPPSIPFIRTDHEKFPVFQTLVQFHEDGTAQAYQGLSVVREAQAQGVCASELVPGHLPSEEVEARHGRL